METHSTAVHTLSPEGLKFEAADHMLPTTSKVQRWCVSDSTLLGTPSQC